MAAAQAQPRRQNDGLGGQSRCLGYLGGLTIFNKVLLC